MIESLLGVSFPRKTAFKLDKGISLLENLLQHANHHLRWWLGINRYFFRWAHALVWYCPTFLVSKMGFRSQLSSLGVPDWSIICELVGENKHLDFRKIGHIGKVCGLYSQI